MSKNEVDEIEKTSNAIAEFLKERRKELNMTQESLADKCNIARNTVVRMEAGSFLPNLELFIRMSYFLKCRIVLESLPGDGQKTITSE